METSNKKNKGLLWNTKEKTPDLIQCSSNNKSKIEFHYRDANADKKNHCQEVRRAMADIYSTNESSHTLDLNDYHQGRIFLQKL